MFWSWFFFFFSGEVKIRAGSGRDSGYQTEPTFVSFFIFPIQTWRGEKVKKKNPTKGKLHKDKI
jgi:hypothetical protein